MIVGGKANRFLRAYSAFHGRKKIGFVANEDDRKVQILLFYLRKPILGQIFEGGAGGNVVHEYDPLAGLIHAGYDYFESFIAALDTSHN